MRGKIEKERGESRESEIRGINREREWREGNSLYK